MPVSVIFGGQYGSEGKGKTAHFFAKELKAKAVIRVGGPNSGHTVINENGEALVLKQLPTASIIPNVHCVISSGSYINLQILKKEIELTKINDSFLCIDPFAVLIEQIDIDKESVYGLKESIGSTGSGTGAAVSRRINRDKNLKFAKDEPELAKYLVNTKSFLRRLLNDNQRVIIEGTQGFGLSLLHSNLYPYTTSRDTSAAAFVSEAGLSPLDVDDIIMVIRTFPIRVAGNSGPLINEISWDDVSAISGSARKLIEYTSVTNKVRRVGRFDPFVVIKAIEVNNPTRIILNHVDYWDESCQESSLSKLVTSNIESIEIQIDRKIDFIGIDRSGLVKLQKLVFSDN